MSDPAKCDLCGHYFANHEEKERHVEREHSTGLDAFGVGL